MGLMDKREHRAFETFIEAADYYWFTEIGHNGLYKVDKQTKLAEFVGYFEGEEDVNRLFLDIVRYENKLIFVPLKAKAIAIYDIDTNVFHRIEIKSPCDDNGIISYSPESKFSFAIVFGADVYFFPITYPAILKLNMQSYGLDYLEKPIQKLNQFALNKDGFYFRKGEKVDNTVVAWCNAMCSLLTFHVPEETFELCVCLKDGNDYIEAVRGENEYWLIPRKSGTLIKLSYDYEVIQKIMLPSGSVKEGVAYIQGVYAGGYLWIFPGTAEHVIRVCAQNNEVKHAWQFEGNQCEEFKVERTDWKFFFAQRINNIIVAFNNFTGEIIFYDSEYGTVENYKIHMNVNTAINKQAILSAFILSDSNKTNNQGRHLYEGGRASLSSYIDLLITSENELVTKMYCRKE